MEQTDNPVIKLDRKTIEKNRRIQMKSLIYQLTSLVPPQHFKPSKDMLPQREQIDQVAGYIKQMREKIENLEKKKEEMMIMINNNTAGIINRSSSSSPSSLISRSDKLKSSSSSFLETPVVKVRDMGSSLEVVIICGEERKLALHEIIRVVEEVGAEVISATASTVGFHVYHILHAQVKVLRFGVDSSMICERFQALMSGFVSK